MALSALWEAHIIVIVTLPYWSFLAILALVDWLLDWVWLGLFGWWCTPCAGFFIWTFNIAYIPFQLLAWAQRFRLETYGLLIDGWMLFFGFSGCYLRYGNDCLFDRSWESRNMRTIWDMPLFFNNDNERTVTQQLKALVTFPTEDTEEMVKVSRANRQEHLSMLPFYDEISTISSSVMEHFDF